MSTVEEEEQIEQSLPEDYVVTVDEQKKQKVDKKLDRKWVFTWNNYTPEVIERLKAHECKYIAFAEEVAPKTGTPHLQGFVVYTGAKSFSSVKNTFDKAYIARMKGRVEQNWKYCNKVSAAWEKGDRQKTQEECGKEGKRCWATIKKLDEEGRHDEMPEWFTHGRVRDWEYMKRRYQQRVELPDVETTHMWFYGEARTGKSRRAREIAREVQPEKKFYRKKAATKWWDGYEDQKVVIIEEFAPKHVYQCEELKEWADRYPFPAEKKNLGQADIRPELIIVTSQYSIQECFPNEKEHLPLLERFKETEFKKLKTSA